MMYNTFSTLKVLQFTDSTTTSLKNIQEGYEKIFPGVIQAMRNPNAHQNSTMRKDEAARKLMIARPLHSFWRSCHRGQSHEKFC